MEIYTETETYPDGSYMELEEDIYGDWWYEAYYTSEGRLIGETWCEDGDVITQGNYLPTDPRNGDGEAQLPDCDAFKEWNR